MWVAPTPHLSIAPRVQFGVTCSTVYRTMPDYSLVGKRARVLLYDRVGRALWAIEGRVADVTEKVPVGRDPATGREVKKDLAYLIDIEPLRDSEGNEIPYKNSAGTENEGWFAVQDLVVVEGQPGATFRN